MSNIAVQTEALNAATARLWAARDAAQAALRAEDEATIAFLAAAVDADAARPYTERQLLVGATHAVFRLDYDDRKYELVALVRPSDEAYHGYERVSDASLFAVRLHGEGPARLTGAGDDPQILGSAGVTDGIVIDLRVVRASLA